MDALGKRLAHSSDPNEEDLDLLRAVLAEYDEPMAAVQDAIQRHLGSLATPRLKSEASILYKLREHHTRLSTMHDLAGARVVKEMTLSEQTRDGREVVRRYPRARLVDRRKRPSYGYRALHVIVFIDDFPVEVQVRTRSQDIWAQAFEKLADTWGRGIRYGHPPEPSEDQEGNTLRQDAIEAMQDISRQIAAVEQLIDRVHSLFVQVKMSEAAEGTAEWEVRQANLEEAENLKGDLARDEKILRERVRRLVASLPLQ